MKNIFARLLLLSTVILSAQVYADVANTTCKEVKFQKPMKRGVGTTITWCDGSWFGTFTSTRRQV